MAELHPSLRDLKDRYGDLFTRISKGTVSNADAKHELSVLIAEDADGVLWRIDPGTGQLQSNKTGIWAATDGAHFAATSSTPEPEPEPVASQEPHDPDSAAAPEQSKTGQRNVLTELVTVYNSVIVRYKAGEITINQATAEVDKLQTVDGKGITWRVERNSGKTQTVVGRAWVNTDASQYVPIDATASPQKPTTLIDEPSIQEPEPEVSQKAPQLSIKLHPYLEDLIWRYEDITTRAADGELDPREAITEIATMRAEDGSGNQWRIDPATGKLQAQAGEYWTNADAKYFASDDSFSSEELLKSLVGVEVYGLELVDAKAQAKVVETKTSKSGGETPLDAAPIIKRYRSEPTIMLSDEAKAKIIEDQEEAQRIQKKRSRRRIRRIASTVFVLLLFVGIVFAANVTRVRVANQALEEAGNAIEGAADVGVALMVANEDVVPGVDSQGFVDLLNATGAPYKYVTYTANSEREVSVYRDSDYTSMYAMETNGTCWFAYASDGVDTREGITLRYATSSLISCDARVVAPNSVIGKDVLTTPEARSR